MHNVGVRGVAANYFAIRTDLIGNSRATRGSSPSGSNATVYEPAYPGPKTTVRRIRDPVYQVPPSCVPIAGGGGDLRRMHALPTRLCHR